MVGTGKNSSQVHNGGLILDLGNSGDDFGWSEKKPGSQVHNGRLILDLGNSGAHFGWNGKNR